MEEPVDVNVWKAANPLLYAQFISNTGGRNPPPQSVNVSGEVSVASSLASHMTIAAEMEMLFDNPKCCELRSKHVWNSISNYLKDQVFPLVKFWRDSDAKFLRPDFRTNVAAENKEQARKICEKLLVFCRRQPDLGNNYSMSYMIAFWKTYVPNIKDGLVRYRSNVTGDAKKLYIKGKLVIVDC